jgi:hypothetical protein
VLEAEQQHRELIKQVEQYRLTQEATAGNQVKTHSGVKLLALIGTGMSSVGLGQESRFGENSDGQINTNSGSNPGGCTS